MTKTEHLNALRLDGFTIMESLIDADLISRIKADLAPYLKGRFMGRNDFEGFKSERVYALLAKTPSIAEIVEHPAIMDLLDQVLPKNYLLSSALAINLHPGETAQSFHIDDNAGGIPIPKPRAALGYSTIWALDAFTEDNGATEIVPGSQHWNNQRQPHPNEILKACMPAGSVLVFNGSLLHRGGANHATQPRLAITPQYCLPGLRTLENMSLAVPPEIARNYSPRVQSLLGYNVIDPGFMGYVDGRHPKRLLDPEYKGRKHRVELPDA